MQNAGLVIGTVTGLSTFQAALQASLFVDVEEEHVLGSAHVLLEMKCLVKSSGEAIDQVVLGRVRDQGVDQNLHGQFERHESSIGHDLADAISLA